MRNYTPTVLVFTGLFLMSVLHTSCKKLEDSSGQPKDQLIMGHWNINRIQLRLYYNGIFAKDTILKQTPKPENFVSFSAGGNFEYKFNTSTSDVGTYEIIGADSVISYVPGKLYRWKMLTLTNVLFTVMNTSTDPAFPGATVETYQTLVK